MLFRQITGFLKMSRHFFHTYFFSSEKLSLPQWPEGIDPSSNICISLYLCFQAWLRAVWPVFIVQTASHSRLRSMSSPELYRSDINYSSAETQGCSYSTSMPLLLLPLPPSFISVFSVSSHIWFCPSQPIAEGIIIMSVGSGSILLASYLTSLSHNFLYLKWDCDEIKLRCFCDY